MSFLFRVTFSVALFLHTNCIGDKDINSFPIDPYAGTETNFYHSQQAESNVNPYYGQQQQYGGYNYITPASTYKTYSPPTLKMQTSQTAPLALSLHADDFQKFDKSQETFFIPRPRQAAAAAIKSVTKPKQDFYVPRYNGQQQSKTGVKLVHEDENVNRGVGNIVSEDSNRAKLLQPQEKWTPMNVLEDSSRFNQRSEINLNPSIPDNSNWDQQENFRQYTTNEFNDSAIKCESSRIQKEEKPINFLAQGNRANEALTTTGKNVPQEQSVTLVDKQHARRLQILRALLAEYLTLSLQNNQEDAQNSNIAATTTATGKTSTETASGARVPIALNSQSEYSIGIRQPHPFYGSPILNRPAANQVNNSFRLKK